MDEVERLVASQLSKETVCGHLRLVPEAVDDAEWRYIDALRRAAIEYVCIHCAVDAEYVDEHEDLAIAVLVLISDMYDQRGMYVDSTNLNRTVEAILSHHDRNFLGSVDDATGRA